MAFEIVASSPKAQELAKKANEPSNKIYPFESLEVGQSFTAKLAEINWKSLRVVCSQKSKNGKKYLFVKHDELGVCEVARTA